MLVALLKELAIAGGQALGAAVVRGVTKLIAGEPDATPLTHAAIEHNRRQEQAAIAAAKADAQKRARPTTRPPRR